MMNVIFLFAAPGPITKRLKKLRSREREDALLAVPDRNALTLLNYKPSYQHFLKKKTRKRKGESAADQEART